MSRGRMSAFSTSLLMGIYHLFSYLISGITIPFWLIRDGRAGGGTSQRYGAVPAEIRQRTERFGCIWMHAASVGEVGVLTRVIPHLARQTPELPVVVTTMTSTGRDRSRQLLKGQADHLYLPLDAPVFVKRTINQLHPQALIIAETELWPNLIRKVARYGAPIIMVNARLSGRASRRYRWVRSGMKGVLNAISVICVKSEVDRERFIALGAEPGRVVVTGDLKYEPLPGVVDTPIDERRSGLGLPAGRPVFTAGSTRQGEEVIVLEAFEHAARQIDDLLMVLAPRYPKRADEVFELIAGSGVRCLRRTELLEGASAEGIEVLLLDTIGELEQFFTASDLAFVGGSLVTVGGHNLLEPAMYGVPVLFGPHTGETAGADSLLLDAGGGRRVDDGQSLGEAIVSLMNDEPTRLAMGEAAREAVRQGRGALDGVIEHYRRALGVGISEVRAARTDRGSRGPRADDMAIGIETDTARQVRADQ
ncbi:3-deoxy-D-manno-octulosonic acid transferase [Gemmatimonadota bacterium]